MKEEQYNILFIVVLPDFSHTSLRVLLFYKTIVINASPPISNIQLNGHKRIFNLTFNENRAF